MTTYPTFTLSKPTGNTRIPEPVLSYMRTRLRLRIHSMILKEFMNSGLSQAQLARRLGRAPRVVHRWLAEPENIRLSTLSDLVFAINGGEPSASVERPLDTPTSNRTLPDWLAHAQDEQLLQKSPPSETQTSAQYAEMKFDSEPLPS